MENAATKPAHQRVNAAGSVSFKTISFKTNEKKTRLDHLYQQGSAKIRFPQNHDNDLEAVLINTAGGLTGGDRLDWTLQLGKGARVVATTQACEKAYRSSEGAAQLSTQILLEEQSELHWLPQETILYEGSSLSRTLCVRMKKEARLLAIEPVMLGRRAMGETIEQMMFRDQWRIWQNNKLVHADNVLLEGNASTLARLGPHAAFASLLYIANESPEQLESTAQKLRMICRNDHCAFSVFEGKLTGRFMAVDAYALRKLVIPIINAMRDKPLPRVWRL